jgi:hypothetical protein
MTHPKPATRVTRRDPAPCRFSTKKQKIDWSCQQNPGNIIALFTTPPLKQQLFRKTRLMFHKLAY